MRGFTLIELLIVIIIIGMLAGLVVPAVMGAIQRAKESTCLNLIHNLESAIQSYWNAYRRYPPSDNGTGSKNLANALKASTTPSGTPFMNLDGMLTPAGDIINPLYGSIEIIYYMVQNTVPHNHGSFSHSELYDLWAKDSAGNPQGINNWQK